MCQALPAVVQRACPPLQACVRCTHASCPRSHSKDMTWRYWSCQVDMHLEQAREEQRAIEAEGVRLQKEAEAIFDSRCGACLCVRARSHYRPVTARYRVFSHFSCLFCAMLKFCHCRNKQLWCVRDEWWSRLHSHLMHVAAAAGGGRSQGVKNHRAEQQKFEAHQRDLAKATGTKPILRSVTALYIFFRPCLAMMRLKYSARVAQHLTFLG